MVKKKEKEQDVHESIKRLLIAQLVLEGVKTETIGKILGIDGSTVRRMVPPTELKRLDKKD